MRFQGNAKIDTPFCGAIQMIENGTDFLRGHTQLDDIPSITLIRSESITLITLNRLFRHWHRVRDGTLARSAFQNRMRSLQRAVKQSLLEGSKYPCVKTAATCFELLKVEEGLWSFASVEGVAPTNNAVERALHHAVIWRRISDGTDSVHGSRFVERMLTGVATCRQRGRNVLDYLTTCFDAHRHGQAVPSLLPVTRKRSRVA